MTLKTSAGRLAFFALAIIAATSLLSGNARACSITGYKKPSKVQIESEARRLYRQSDYIAEVTVVKVPKYNRDNSVIAGSARVGAMIKGSPSKILKIPPPGPCGNQYGVGDRLIVFFKNGKEMHPSSYEVVGAIQRLKLGNWRKVRGPVFRVGPFKI